MVMIKLMLAMKLSLAVAALLAGKTFAFSPHRHHHDAPSSFAKTITMMSSPISFGGGGGNNGMPPTKPKKVLTAADVMAKSNSSPTAAAAASENDAPQLFSPAVYNDFQSTLLLLEKRINSGPSSLTHSEIQQFEEQTTRIVMEMKDYLMDPVGSGEAIRKGYQKEEEGAAAPPPQSAIATAAVPPSSSSTINHQVRDVFNLENDAPSNGANEEYANFGLARGTTNTYVIPGMEEMSPEEYRDKLQETISARQVSDLVSMSRETTQPCWQMFHLLAYYNTFALSSLITPSRFRKKKSGICLLFSLLGGKEETKSILGYNWQS